MSGFDLKIDVSGALAHADVVADASDEAARPAAQAATQVIYDRVKSNVARIKRHTGNLDRAIYQAFSADNSGPGRATYHVSWNAKKAPHGHLVEFGHLQRYEVSFDKQTGRFITHKDRPLAQPRQVGARPFVRPAVAVFERAMQAAQDRYIAELQARGAVS
jgi:HK97 gp10 family phage protein